ncbi:hypothetical protein GGTG_08535 [Gaeumannomyces tritici R3-111a-1]|uniref:Uncharacterized protein n=1 Tax=Gaeumannomyces tritici (strain R3-111a-1) TaxID=644352 RepID=J3P4U9_GAET3|nr:hypothetical protein GGTG_08535 [Gaeumannomyces tritici R3-111a-1]EJT74697.1 hypothetical protein GGTG_08535 [Gaeumannomyces tritici R3-111a-1]
MAWDLLFLERHASKYRHERHHHHVEVERHAPQEDGNWGMLIGRVGLPPGRGHVDGQRQSRGQILARIKWSGQSFSRPVLSEGPFKERAIRQTPSQDGMVGGRIEIRRGTGWGKRTGAGSLARPHHSAT